MTIQAQSIYNDTVDLLKTLDENQLTAVHSMIIELTDNKDEWHSPLGIKTEEELWAHIDHSLAQIDSGECIDSEEFEKEMMAGISG